jgi:O-antigen/teichoic acid export membrane protein
MIIPFTHFIDSFLIVNLLNDYRQDATALYGILSGACLTVINLPVSLCYGVAMVAIPSVSSSKTQEERLTSAKKSINFTLLFSLPCAVFCLFFSPFIINLLFKGLSASEKSTAISLLRLLSPCVVLSAVVQTQNAVLIGQDKSYKSVLSLAVGAVFKILINLSLLKNPKINIYGSAIALIACYFVTGLINLIMIFGVRIKNASTNANRREYAS